MYVSTPHTLSQCHCLLGGILVPLRRLLLWACWAAITLESLILLPWECSSPSPLGAPVFRSSFICCTPLFRCSGSSNSFLRNILKHVMTFLGGWIHRFNDQLGIGWWERRRNKKWLPSFCMKCLNGWACKNWRGFEVGEDALSYLRYQSAAAHGLLPEFQKDVRDRDPELVVVYLEVIAKGPDKWNWLGRGWRTKGRVS